MKKAIFVAVLLLLLLFAGVGEAQVCMGNGPGCPSGGGVAGSGGITSGAAGTGCTAFSIVYIDTGGNLACAQGPINGSTTTAGTGTTTILASISGASSGSNLLKIEGAFNASLSAETNAVNLIITGDNDAQDQSAFKVLWTPNVDRYTAGAVNVATSAGAFNGVAGLFTNNLTGTTLNYGLAGLAIGGASTRNIGVFGYGVNATTGLVAGGLFSGGTAPRSFGVYASGDSDSATSFAGGYFTIEASPALIGTQPALVTYKAAIVANNQAIAAPVAIFADNGAAVPTTAATATVTVQDGAMLQNGNTVLTNATMTAENQGQARTAWHSYTWSNAQVVALGATTVGDITVATLPAKTMVRNAYVVITGAAAGPATVTVSCGDAIAGTPFINYVVASDAKAAANTVYGDAVAERGTSIDVEFYYVPSYTATTLVTCHFISTGANLDTVTGSTGRVILETALIP